jgi:Protein of Unknown function (DUF2784)
VIDSRILADAVVLFHAAYVTFVVCGFAAIVLGSAFEWEWVREFWFRLAHLVAIGVVFLEEITGEECPLTTLEDALRAGAGQQRYADDFVGYWAHRLIFYNAPAWEFAALYAGFTLLVASAFWFVPPKLPWRNDRAQV